MIDQYFGIKELYELVLKAKTPMQFGSRRLEAGEPVLYFENIEMSMLSERSSPIMARGGWANMPRVIWEDRSEVTFSLREGVMSSISMGILFSANMLEKQPSQNLAIPIREGPYELDENNSFWLNHMPISYPRKKTFIYEYERDVGQKKVYGEITETKRNIMGEDVPHIRVIDGDVTKQYIIDYYYEYKDDALIYLIQKERFKGLFTLEGKFYSKDENEGINYTNLIYMPSVRIVSDINLRLGERADPTSSVFNIIGLPEKTEDSDNLIVKIIRLGEDINSDI